MQVSSLSHYYRCVHDSFSSGQCNLFIGMVWLLLYNRMNSISFFSMKKNLTEQELLNLYRGFYIFGDSTCLKILYELERYGEKNFTELKEILEVNPSTLTKKLRLLCDSGLITADRSRDKLRIYYSIAAHEKSLKRLLDAFERLCHDMQA